MNKRQRKKQRKKMMARVEARMRDPEVLKKIGEAGSEFIMSMLRRPSVAGALLPQPLQPEFARIRIGSDPTVHWSGLVSKSDVERELWPRVTYCDGDTDLYKHVGDGFEFVEDKVSCMVCLARCPE